MNRSAVSKYRENIRRYLLYFILQLLPPRSIWLLTDKYGCNATKVFNIQDYFPNATFNLVYKKVATLNGILEDVEQLARNFNKLDFIIIYGGLTDCLTLNIIDTSRLERVFRNLEHTNIIVLGVPLTKYNDINHIVADSDNNLKDACETAAAVRYIDVNPIIFPFIDGRIYVMKIMYDLILLNVINVIVDSIQSLHHQNIWSL